jgi:hypothetical protein
VIHNAAPRQRAQYTLPLTAAVDPLSPAALVEFLDAGGLALALMGQQDQDGRWFGALQVTRAGDIRLATNGNTQSLAADLWVVFYA